MTTLTLWVTLGCLAICVAIIGLEVKDDAWYNTKKEEDDDDQDDD